jgi:transcriptional regulator with XRE-family HTH domain
MADDDPWATQRKLLGTLIRSQRHLAKLSLRDLAARTSISNPYLSQIERGLHEPSLRVLTGIAEALDVSADALLSQAGFLRDRVDAQNPTQRPATTTAIRTDPDLTEAQKVALLAVYDSYREANSANPPSDRETAHSR